MENDDDGREFVCFTVMLPNTSYLLRLIFNSLIGSNFKYVLVMMSHILDSSSLQSFIYRWCSIFLSIIYNFFVYAQKQLAANFMCDLIMENFSNWSKLPNGAQNCNFSQNIHRNISLQEIIWNFILVNLMTILNNCSNRHQQKFPHFFFIEGIP